VVFKSAAIAALVSVALAQVKTEAQTKHVTTPPDISSATYTGPVSKVKPPTTSQRAKSGPVQIAIKLSDPPLAVAVGANAKQNGITMTAAQQRAYLAQIAAKQDAIAAGHSVGRNSPGAH